MLEELYELEEVHGKILGHFILVKSISELENDIPDMLLIEKDSKTFPIIADNIELLEDVRKNVLDGIGMVVFRAGITFYNNGAIKLIKKKEDNV